MVQGFKRGAKAQRHKAEKDRGNKRGKGQVVMSRERSKRKRGE